jgi:hypothetical protein
MSQSLQGRDGTLEEVLVKYERLVTHERADQ